MRSNSTNGGTRSRAPAASRILADPVESNLTLQPGGKRIVRVGDLETHANRTARCVEDMIDDGNGRSIPAAYWFFRIDFRDVARTYPAELAQRKKHFNVKRVDLRYRNEVRLVEGIFPRSQRPRHNHSAYWTANCALLENFACSRHLELGELQVD